MKTYKLGIDVGGTFTDGVLIDETTGAVVNVKVPSTPGDPSIGFLNNLDQIIDVSKIDSKEIWFLVHGTTVATNSIIEGKIAKTALITTQGFKDILEIAFQIRPKLYDVFVEKPVPLIPRNLCFEVSERMGPDGEIIEPLNKTDVREIIETLKEEKIQSVVVCLLHSYINNSHEKLIKEMLDKEYPEVHCTLSSEICPEFREYPRASTSVINGCIIPVVSQYLNRIEKGLKDRGVFCGCHLMQSNGGVVNSDIAKIMPCKIIESGPAAGVTIASHIAKQVGRHNVICIDIGGTTAKVGIVLNGEPRITPELEVGAAAFARSTARRASGYPLRTPSIDLVEIGAGGGSIAWLDSGGILRVGPQSAGAVPGPACYPNGGEKPTLTDANLVLGRLNPDYFIGGKMKLRVERAYEAIHNFCSKQLQRRDIETAAGIINVAISNMVNAIRFVSVEKGYDPRDFALIITGGAGPLHSNLLSDELKIPCVIVPPSPGLASALGLLVTDIKQEASKTVVTIKHLTWDKIKDVIGTLSNEVKALLKKQGVKENEINVLPSADMRYGGQSYELNVLLDPHKLSEMTLYELSNLFHEEHQRAYGYSAPDEKPVIVNVKVTGIGTVKRHKTRTLEKGDKEVGMSAVKGQRNVYFEKKKDVVDCTIYNRNKLLSNNIIMGPAVVEEVDSTTLILPGYKGAIDEFGNILITQV